MGLRVKRDESPSEQATAEEVQCLWESASAVRKRKVSWLWSPRIPAGEITLIEGAPSCGKSSLCASIAASVTAARRLHGQRRITLGQVLWLAAEEDYATTTVPRLVSCGADLSRIHVPSEKETGERRKIMLPDHLPALAALVRERGITLVVVDPLTSFLSTAIDLRVDQSIHSALDPIADLAHATGCSFLLQRHLKKDSSGPRIYQGMGGVGLSAVARAILAIDWPDQRTARRVIRAVKWSNGPRPLSLEYLLNVENGTLTMGKCREIPLCDDDPDADQADKGERDVRGDARVLLARMIGKEWVSAVAITREAEAAAIGLRTLRSAKADMGVRSRRVGSAVPAYWEWGPPLNGWA